MMTLAQASSYFDRTQALDAYSGAPLFMAQVAPYDESRRDAMAAYRRVMSVAPGTVIPGHRCVSLLGSVWIVSGEPEIDGLDEQYRVKYVLQPAADLLSIGSITSFLNSETVPAVYGFADWVKDSKAQAESSDIASVFDVMLAGSVQVLPHQMIWKSGTAYLTLSVRALPSGFTGVSAVRLDQVEPLEAGIQSRVYNPVTGAYTLGAQDFPYGLRVRWQSLFKYDVQTAARYRDGDLTLALPEDATIDTSTRIDFDGQTYTVLSVRAIDGAVTAHVRRA